KPTLAITALNCPAEMLANEQFACTPEFTTNLPDNYKTGIVKAWTGDGLVVAGDKMSFATPGAKTLTYTLTYPGADPATATASIAIGGSSIAITSLGCPAELKTQESFRCTPVIETDMTQTYQDKLTYTWTGSNMETADDGFMAMTASGNKGLTLVVALPEKNISVKKSEYINVILSDTNIKSVGCPSTAYYGDPFTCAPDVETVGDPNALEFVWSGTALGNDSNGKLLFASSGTDNKSVNKITLTVTNPETGFTMQRTQKVNVSPISVVVSALGCSSRIKSQQPFKCTPAVKVNALKIKEGLQYAWSGDDMTVRENGTFVFKTEGTKTINLRITHPAYPQIQISEDYTVEVTKPILTVNGLGCPRYISEYINANCFPQISNDDTLGNVVYDWKLNGESVGTQKIGRMIFKAPGTSTVSLTARLVDPDTGETIVSSTLPEEKTVSPNKNPLRLYVRGPSLAEQGTEITLEAKTTFQVDEIVDYTWNIGGTEYKGAIITVPVPATQAEPIAYTVTAKPNCCEMIAAETRTGAVRVGEYRFPTIMFSGPRSSETNIAPFDALFKTGVITTSNLTYTWDFGDGSPLEVTDKTTTRKTHTYATPGTYTAKLSVKDKNDEVREYTTEVVVVPLPTRNLAIESTMLNPYSRRPVMGYFKYGITDGVRQDYPLSSTWSVNDVVVSDRPSALINFNETGTHMVKLEVKTKYGNLLNTTKAVDVVENQHPQCTIMQSLFAVGKYLLTANCTDSDGKVVRYKWDLGGGITSSSQKAYLTVKQEGSYPVSLTATDDSGDSVTVNGVISVTDINAAPTGE
ncbi:MAG TPA: PKD domain-containing protein, partial [Smithella sp.]|nr:PKD domain-containing protein [Smithella sp.]